MTDAERTDSFTSIFLGHVFYIAPKGSMPKKLESTVHFQNGSHVYNVPANLLCDYDLEKN